MDVQTSFIPKRTLDTNPRIERADTVSIFTLLSVLIFFLSVAAAGGVFLWQKNLEKQIADVKSVIIREKDSFSVEDINQLDQLEKRLISGQQLLDSKLYTSRIFNLLNENTIKTVRFTKLTVDPSTVEKDKLKITVSGQAKDYASLALQAHIFSGLSDSFIEYDFSNLTLDLAGNVTFDMNATFAKDSLVFSANPKTVNHNQVIVPASNGAAVESSGAPLDGIPPQTN